MPSDLPSNRIQVSATEIPSFRRLVAFVSEVDAHADEQCDAALQEIVRGLRIDLLELMTREREPEDFDA